MNKRRLSVEWKEQARPIGAYWFLLLFSFFIFTVALITIDRSLKSNDILILIGIFATSSLGCALGQLAALYRFREVIGVIHGLCALFFGGLLLSFGLPEFLTVACGMYMFFGTLMFFAGMWSIQAGRVMFATWPPLIFGVGGVIGVINDSPESLETWKSGSKWMVWNATSLTGFLIAIMLPIFYLVIRENLRIFRWRNGPRTTIASDEILQKEAKARIAMKGWIWILGLAFLLSLGVAILSPYLWQTEPRDSGEEYSETVKEKKTIDCDNYSGCSPPPECRENTQGGTEKKPPPKPGSGEQFRQVMEQVGQFLWILMWMLILLLLAYFVFGAPMRRIFYVRHYRDPLWPISTTKKIENQWDLIRIALADLGIYGQRGDSATTLVEQAIPKLQQITGSTRRIPGLRDAAMIRDRVVFGLGVGKEDAKKMNENANWVYDSVWNRLGNTHQIKALYRWKLW